MRESDFTELDERDPATLVAHALEEPAAERLAVDQPRPSGPRHRPRPEIERLLERQRLATEKAWRLAERMLAEAERELDSRFLGGCGRRGQELRAEAAFQRRALELAEERLRELERIAAQRERAERTLPVVADDWSRVRSRTHGRAPRLEGGRHLDLGR